MNEPPEGAGARAAPCASSSDDDLMISAGATVCRGCVVVAGCRDDDRRGTDGAQHAQQPDAVEVGQAQVEDHDVGLAADR